MSVDIIDDVGLMKDSGVFYFNGFFSPWVKTWEMIEQRSIQVHINPILLETTCINNSKYMGFSVWRMHFFPLTEFCGMRAKK